MTARSPETRVERLLEVDDLSWLWEIAAVSRNQARAMWRWYQSRKPLCLLAPRERAIYDRIVRLRSEIGPVDIDVVELLREIREE